MCVRRAPGAAILLAFAACARPAPPPEIPPSLARAPAIPTTAPLEAAPAAPACLPAMQSPIVTLLDGDARTVHACFFSPELASPACFAIDRRRGSIASWRPAAVSTSPQPDHRRPSTTLMLRSQDPGDVCAHKTTCGHLLAQLPPLPDGYACGDSIWLDPSTFVETSDCESSGQAFLFTADGHRFAQVGGEQQPLNTFGAYVVYLENRRWAIVAPNGYQIVIVDQLLRQTSIDLVPIQARSTESPAFTLVQAADYGYLVASPTGGVGVIDPIAAKLTASWIIPACDEASGP